MNGPAMMVKMYNQLVFNNIKIKSTKQIKSIVYAFKLRNSNNMMREKSSHATFQIQWWKTRKTAQLPANIFKKEE